MQPDCIEGSLEFRFFGATCAHCETDHRVDRANVRVMGLPIVDVAPLAGEDGERREVARLIGAACRESGFFYVVGHGIDPTLEARLESTARSFFASDLATKMHIAMEHAGAAWRGYFPVGSELTSGVPDKKEGLYFGLDLPADDPRVVRKVPLHGANLYPPSEPAMRPVVSEYMAALTALGATLMEGVALSLGLPASTFEERYTKNPLVLFRIFNYPPAQDDSAGWGVGEHTDYGLLTILKQDDTGGLQVKSPAGWIDVPPLRQAFVCNIGDMLERMTRGRYRSTPHRVRNATNSHRLSFPFFFDPGFDAEVAPLPLPLRAADDRRERWDGESVHDLAGTYGDYLLRKVGRVFPQLRATL